MTIRIRSDGRFSINGLSELNVRGSTQKSGFRGHWSMTGWILSCGCIDKAFKDKHAGWVNKRSAVKYLQRVRNDLGSDTIQQIDQLNKKSSTQEVQALFNKAKLGKAGMQDPKPDPAVSLLPKPTVDGIKLENGTYPAFPVRIVDKNFILLMEQDRGNRNFYEMLSQQAEDVVLISSLQAHSKKDRSITEFSKTLKVSQYQITEIFGTTYRVLRINQKTINDNILNGFKIDAEGLKSAHKLIRMNTGETIVLNADYEEGLLFAGMMGVFHLLANGARPEDITIPRIQERVTGKVEGQLGVKGLDIRSLLAKAGYDTDEKLQEAIKICLKIEG